MNSAVTGLIKCTRHNTYAVRCGCGVRGMSIVKSTLIAGLAITGLALIPVKPVAATDYIAAYGMYERGGLWYSSNYYINYIIQHESSGRPWVANYLGCIGLMQSCPYNGAPAGLAVACPNWAQDVNCQLDFFSQYANSRYGSFYNSYLHSRTYGWW